MADIWEDLKKIDCEKCAIHEDCDHNNLCAEWITKAKPELLKNKEKAGNWDRNAKMFNDHVQSLNEEREVLLKKLEALGEQHT